jgi:hypothetical protein
MKTLVGDNFEELHEFLKELQVSFGDQKIMTLEATICSHMM